MVFLYSQMLRKFYSQKFACLQTGNNFSNVKLAQILTQIILVTYHIELSLDDTHTQSERGIYFMDSLLLVYLIITLSITISQKVIMMGNNNRETISMSRVKLNGEKYMCLF